MFLEPPWDWRRSSQDNIELFAEIKRTEDKLAAIEDDEKDKQKDPYGLFIIIKNIYLPYLIKIDLHFEPFSNFNVAKPMHHMWTWDRYLLSIIYI